ncbi:hypothetical protein ABK040_002367 [Willaertia magna]
MVFKHHSVTSIYGGHSEITITSDISFNSFKYYSIDKIKYFYISFTDPNIVVYIKNGSIPTITIYDYYVDEQQVTVVRAGSLSEEWFIGVYGKYSTIFTIDVFTNN